ncbi:MAG: aminotransferase class III-fold pyridoxal phosphate-dependent enzyme [Lentisphaerae bacterium]|nr:aminotransferase class III-fold pyridoxal phosphate-dependent enzyme [Lentisphaerota bacterium]
MNDQELYRHAKTVIPGGTGLLSKRPEMLAPELFPAYFKAAKGCRITTIDDREFVDFTTCGIGACLLGFNDEDVTQAVVKTAMDGSFSTLNPPEEVALADKLCAIHPWASWARFARGGGDIGAVAIRIARAATGRSKVMIIGYHGWHDWYLAANLCDPDALGGMWLKGLSPHGVPAELKGTAVACMHGDFEQLDALLKTHGNDLAAIILEPCRHEVPAPGFLEALRAGCDKYGALLIYDEITIGWRYRFGGSHLDFGVDPDLAIFSKALGNGHPIAAVLGRKEFFDGASKAFLSSTYWTERIGPAAALATIDKMERTNAAVHANNYGMQVMALWEKCAADAGLPLQLTSKFGCLASFQFKTPAPNVMRTLFTRKMLEKGILAGTGFYPTVCHGKAEFDLYAAAVSEVFSELAPIAAGGEDAVRAALTAPEAHTTFARLVK